MIKTANETGFSAGEGTPTVHAVTSQTGGGTAENDTLGHGRTSPRTAPRTGERTSPPWGRDSPADPPPAWKAPTSTSRAPSACGSELSTPGGPPKGARGDLWETGGTQDTRPCTSPPSRATARWSRCCSLRVPGALDLFHHRPFSSTPEVTHLFADGCSHSTVFAHHSVPTVLGLCSDTVFADVPRISTIFHMPFGEDPPDAAAALEPKSNPRR